MSSDDGTLDATITATSTSTTSSSSSSSSSGLFGASPASVSSAPDLSSSKKRAKKRPKVRFKAETLVDSDSDNEDGDETEDHISDLSGHVKHSESKKSVRFDLDLLEGGRDHAYSVPGPSQVTLSDDESPAILLVSRSVDPSEGGSSKSAASMTSSSSSSTVSRPIKKKRGKAKRRASDMVTSSSSAAGGVGGSSTPGASSLGRRTTGGRKLIKIRRHRLGKSDGSSTSDVDSDAHSKRNLADIDDFLSNPFPNHELIHKWVIIDVQSPMDSQSFLSPSSMMTGGTELLYRTIRDELKLLPSKTTTTATTTAVSSRKDSIGRRSRGGSKTKTTKSKPPLVSSKTSDSTIAAAASASSSSSSSSKAATTTTTTAATKKTKKKRLSTSEEISQMSAALAEKQTCLILLQTSDLLLLLSHVGSKAPVSKRNLVRCAIAKIKEHYALSIPVGAISAMNEHEWIETTIRKDTRAFLSSYRRDTKYLAQHRDRMERVIHERETRKLAERRRRQLKKALLQHSKSDSKMDSTGLLSSSQKKSDGDSGDPSSSMSSVKEGGSPGVTFVSSSSSSSHRRRATDSHKGFVSDRWTLVMDDSQLKTTCDEICSGKRYRSYRKKSEDSGMKKPSSSDGSKSVPTSEFLRGSSSKKPSSVQRKLSVPVKRMSTATSDSKRGIVSAASLSSLSSSSSSGGRGSIIGTGAVSPTPVKNWAIFNFLPISMDEKALIIEKSGNKGVSELARAVSRIKQHRFCLLNFTYGRIVRRRQILLIIWNPRRGAGSGHASRPGSRRAGSQGTRTGELTNTELTNRLLCREKIRDYVHASKVITVSSKSKLNWSMIASILQRDGLLSEILIRVMIPVLSVSDYSAAADESTSSLKRESPGPPMLLSPQMRKNNSTIGTSTSSSIGTPGSVGSAASTMMFDVHSDRKMVLIYAEREWTLLQLREELEKIHKVGMKDSERITLVTEDMKSPKSYSKFKSLRQAKMVGSSEERDLSNESPKATLVELNLWHGSLIYVSPKLPDILETPPSSLDIVDADREDDPESDLIGGKDLKPAAVSSKSSKKKGKQKKQTVGSKLENFLKKRIGHSLGSIKGGGSGDKNGDGVSPETAVGSAASDESSDATGTVKSTKTSGMMKKGSSSSSKKSKSKSGGWTTSSKKKKKMMQSGDEIIDGDRQNESDVKGDEDSSLKKKGFAGSLAELADAAELDEELRTTEEEGELTKKKSGVDEDDDSHSGMPSPMSHRHSTKDSESITRSQSDVTTLFSSRRSLSADLGVVVGDQPPNLMVQASEGFSSETRSAEYGGSHSSLRHRRRSASMMRLRRNFVQPAVLSKDRRTVLESLFRRRSLSSKEEDRDIGMKQQQRKKSPSLPMVEPLLDKMLSEDLSVIGEMDPLSPHFKPDPLLIAEQQRILEENDERRRMKKGKENEHRMNIKERNEEKKGELEDDNDDERRLNASDELTDDTMRTGMKEGVMIMDDMDEGDSVPTTLEQSSSSLTPTDIPTPIPGASLTRASVPITSEDVDSLDHQESQTKSKLIDPPPPELVESDSSVPIPVPIPIPVPVPVPGSGMTDEMSAMLARLEEVNKQRALQPESDKPKKKRRKARSYLHELKEAQSSSEDDDGATHATKSPSSKDDDRSLTLLLDGLDNTSTVTREDSISVLPLPELQVIPDMSEAERHNFDLDDVFIVQEKVGVGKTAVVHKALYKDMATVALKEFRFGRLTESIMNEFVKEVAVLENLRHPNVALMLGSHVDTDAHELYLMLEWLPGGCLYDLIHCEDLEIGFIDTLVMCLDIARGMEYLHSCNIIHRDLKSHNLLLDEEYRVKVTDFGTAKPLDKLKQAMTELGTVGFMAPEILEPPYTFKVDIWSYGVVIWEILTRGTIENVFKMFTLSKYVKLCRKGQRPDIPEDCPMEFKHLINSCWEFRAHKRPEFKQIVQILTKLLMIFDDESEAAYAYDSDLSVLDDTGGMGRDMYVEYEEEEDVDDGDSAEDVSSSPD